MSNLTGSRQPTPPYGARRPAQPAVPPQRGPYRQRQQAPARLPSRHEQTSRFRRRRLQWAIPWLFLAPALVLFLYFKIMPLLQGVKMSFYDVRPYLGDRYVGWGNYADATTQPLFTQAIWQTVILAIGTTAGSILIGFLLAILVEGQARHLWLVRTAAFLPVVTTMAVVAEVWKVMYYPDRSGALNTILGWIGVGPEPFLQSPHQALSSVIAVGIWRGAPYDMMIFLAGLATVDRNLYESAAVDGASRWTRFLHVTLPSLRPVITILFLLAALRGLRSFTEVFLLTNGGPGQSTQVLMVLIYKLGFEQSKLGVAAAASMILFVATAAITVAVYAWRRRGAALR
jgi:multiple sugar transport system permease protein